MKEEGTELAAPQDPVLSKKNDGTRCSFKIKRDSLKAELYLHITSEQKKNLDDKFKEMEKH